MSWIELGQLEQVIVAAHDAVGFVFSGEGAEVVVLDVTGGRLDIGHLTRLLLGRTA